MSKCKGEDWSNCDLIGYKTTVIHWTNSSIFFWMFSYIPMYPIGICICWHLIYLLVFVACCSLSSNLILSMCPNFLMWHAHLCIFITLLMLLSLCGILLFPSLMDKSLFIYQSPAPMCFPSQSLQEKSTIDSISSLTICL